MSATWLIKTAAKSSFRKKFVYITWSSPFNLEKSYIKIENFRTIKLSDKILSENLFVRNLVMSESFLSESFKFIENRKEQRSVTLNVN